MSHFDMRWSQVIIQCIIKRELKNTIQCDNKHRTPYIPAIILPPFSGNHIGMLIVFAYVHVHTQIIEQGSLNTQKS